MITSTVPHVDSDHMILSVWSDYGHTFLSDGDDDTDDEGRTLGHYVSCLTCGAHYVQRPTADGGWDDPDVAYIRGEYVTNAGEEPAECSGDTSMIHGYRGEREGVCDYTNQHVGWGETCEHCDHACPCVLCDS